MYGEEAVPAEDTRHSDNFSTPEAISWCAARELSIVEAIEQGLNDIRTGNFMPHAEIASEARAVLRSAKLKP